MLGARDTRRPHLYWRDGYWRILETEPRRGRQRSVHLNYEARVFARRVAERQERTRQLAGVRGC